jgi:hypothetical protein
MESGRERRGRPLNSQILDLLGRIEVELEEIERAVRSAHGAWEGALRFPEQQDHFLNSLTLNLHGFYNGLEKIFEIIARKFDDSFPGGEHWHRKLLKQMGQEQPGARPAVLSDDSVKGLDEFLAFRHRVRNLYTFNLEAKRLHELLQRLPSAWRKTRADITLFLDLLRRAGGED